MMNAKTEIRTLVQDFRFETGFADTELEDRINDGWDGGWEIIDITVTTTYSQVENEECHHRIVTLKRLVDTEETA